MGIQSKEFGGLCLKLGTLTQFMELRKINTIGLGQANKVMHLSAMAAYTTSVFQG